MKRIVQTSVGKGLSLTKGAQEFGVEPKTLRAALERSGVAVSRGARYTILDMAGALYGDKEREQTRVHRADADRRELENGTLRKELVPMGEVQKIVTDMLLPVRQRFLSLPGEACARCNPADPQFAREALQRWVDESLPIIREGMPK